MNRFRPLPLWFFRRPAEVVAQELLGCYLVRKLPDQTRLVVQILETEAYLGAEDPASHARGGHRSARNESMYLDGGHAYVYRIYGLHWCFNVVCATAEVPHAVLLRAGRAIEGRERMAELRGLPLTASDRRLLGGPARLTEALAIDRSFDGVSLRSGALQISCGEPFPNAQIERTPRIGVEYAGEAATWPLRFVVVGLEPPSARLGGKPRRIAKSNSPETNR